MKTFIKKSVIDTHTRRGAGNRIVALLAIVGISACTAVRLDAVVIDDFEGPVKFAEGGGGTNYFLFGLTNLQLAVSRQNPIPTPPSSVGTTYDNVYWPNSLPGVSLEGGRTLELRMDLNHTSADDLFLLLGGGGDGDNSYAAIVDRNEVALMKYGVLGFTTFYWDVLAITNENVTVRLAFTKTNSSLAITVKIVDKGNLRATLYERAFVDGPGQDGPVPPPDPHGTKLFNQDLGAPYTNFTYAWAGVWQLIPTSPPPLEMLLDNCAGHQRCLAELDVAFGGAHRGRDGPACRPLVPLPAATHPDRRRLLPDNALPLVPEVFQADSRNPVYG
jgi:hypothetical protein